MALCLFVWFPLWCPLVLVAPGSFSLSSEASLVTSAFAFVYLVMSFAFVLVKCRILVGWSFSFSSLISNPTVQTSLVSLVSCQSQWRLLTCDKSFLWLLSESRSFHLASGQRPWPVPSPSIPLTIAFGKTWYHKVISCGLEAAFWNLLLYHLKSSSEKSEESCLAPGSGFSQSLASWRCARGLRQEKVVRVAGAIACIHLLWSQ